MQQKKTNKWVKRMAAGLLVCLLALVLAFAGCAPQGPYVVSVRPGSGRGQNALPMRIA